MDSFSNGINGKICNLGRSLFRITIGYMVSFRFSEGVSALMVNKDTYNFYTVLDCTRHHLHD